MQLRRDKIIDFIFSRESSHRADITTYYIRGEKQVFAAANMINKQGVPGKNIGEWGLTNVNTL